MIPPRWNEAQSDVIAATYTHTLHYWFQEKFKTTWYHQVVSTNSNGGQPSIAWTGASVIIADTCNAGSELGLVGSSVELRPHVPPSTNPNVYLMDLVVHVAAGPAMEGRA